MNCPKCGKEVTSKTKYCPHCGMVINNGLNKKITILASCIMIVLLLIIAFITISNNKKSRYLFAKNESIYCKYNVDSSLCTEEEQNDNEDFDSLDFNDFDFSKDDSYQSFLQNLINIIDTKNSEGNMACRDSNYVNVSNKLNKDLNLRYSYLCGMDITFLNNLTERLEEFFKVNKIDERIVDAYVVGKASSINEYANYTGQIIGSNDKYIAYLRRIHMSLHMFSDYDKVKKAYERDLEANYHAKNSIPEDIIVHETGHAINFYIVAKKNGIDDIVIDDYDKLVALYDDWSGQKYAKEVVQKAVSIVNSQSSTMKSELELRQEISGYAASENNGVIMYAETFAEALVDYFSNGVSASPLSIAIFNIVQEDLNNL